MIRVIKLFVNCALVCTFVGNVQAADIVGYYYLQIKDADNRTANYIFRVVKSKPAYPKALVDTSVSEDTRLTAQATWLAAQKRKKWVFEAYQDIAALAESYPAARIVRYKITPKCFSKVNIRT